MRDDNASPADVTGRYYNGFEYPLFCFSVPKDCIDVVHNLAIGGRRLHPGTLWNVGRNRTVEPISYVVSHQRRRSSAGCNHQPLQLVSILLSSAKAISDPRWRGPATSPQEGSWVEGLSLTTITCNSGQSPPSVSASVLS